MYTFRQLTTDDYEDFKTLISEFRPTEFTRERFLEILALIKKSSEVWLLCHNNKILATGTLILEHKFIFDTCIYAHVEDVCVRESERNKGLGKLLMQHLMSRAKELKCHKITLDCADHNIPFYLKCGLERRGNQMCQLLTI